MFKRKIYFLLTASALLILPASSLQSCSRKSGCPIAEEATTKVDKHGNYKVSKTKSGLLPKKARKKKK